MKIAVVSDTHRMNRYIDIAKKYIEDADVLIHLGDNVDDVEELSKGFKGTVYAVRGNCDYTDKYPSEQLIELEGKRIFITHGHLYGVKSTLNNIYYRAKELEANIVLFGHTHENLIIEEDSIKFMNPGSISLPRSMGRHVGFIEVSDGKVNNIYLKRVKI